MARTAFVALACGVLGAANALEVVTPSEGLTVVADRSVVTTSGARTLHVNVRCRVRDPHAVPLPSVFLPVLERASNSSSTSCLLQILSTWCSSLILVLTEKIRLIYFGARVLHDVMCNLGLALTPSV